MPHSFKLAHRLSRFRDVNLLLLTCIAACFSADSPPTAPRSVPAAARDPRTVVIRPARVVDTIRQQQVLIAVVTNSIGQAVQGAIVAWSTSNAAVAQIAPTGRLTAVAVGSATITAKSAGAAGTAVVSVTATPPPPPLPGAVGWPIVEDFSTYTSWNPATCAFSPDRGIYIGGDWENCGSVTLDRTQGVSTNGLSLKQSLEYTYPNRTGDAGRCGDYTIGNGHIALPNTVAELWVEIYVKFDPSFTTVAPPSWNCTSNADHKTMFIVTTPDNRYEVKTGTSAQAESNQQYRWWPRAPSGNDNINLNVNPYDGAWHRVRMHARLSRTLTSADGLFVVYVDGVQATNQQGINTPNNAGAAVLANIYGLVLGANLNQGPGQVQRYWFGRVEAWNANPGWGF